MYIYTHVYTQAYIEIYFKKLVYVIMETEKFPDLQLANWRPRS